ncbi:MAG: C39 family peptidase [Chloroflexota bacterium]
MHGFDPTLDPRWAESGAKTPEEYAYWMDRACGIACLKMCIEALGGPKLTIMDWVRIGLENDGYLIRYDANNKAEEVGWIHSSLAILARKFGIIAEAKAANESEIIKLLKQGSIVTASVSYEIGDDRLDITKKGGHLIVIMGAEYDENGPLAFFINNPSGRRKELQAGARIQIERFAPAFSGRIITFQR